MVLKYYQNDEALKLAPLCGYEPIKTLFLGRFNNRIFSFGIHFLVGVLMLTGISCTQICLGGTRPALAYPGYLLVACAGVFSLFIVGAKRYSPGWGALFSTVLFFGYLLGRGFYSPFRFLATTNTLLILGALVIYALTAAFLTGTRARLLMIGGLLCLEAGHVWMGLTQFVSGNKWLMFDYPRPDYGSRASGFYTCPDHLAGFLEMFALVLLAIGLFSRVSVSVRIIFFYFACAGFTGVLITGSRGGYLSSGAGLMVLGIYGGYHLICVERFRTPLVLLGAGCGCTVLVLGVAFVAHNDLLNDRFSSIAEQDVRPHLWQAGIRTFALDPVVGTGAGTYLIYGREFRDASVQTDPVYVHNDYLELLAEYGLVGGILLVGFLVAHLLTAWKFVRWRLRKLGQNKKALSCSLALHIGAAAGIAALAVHSVFDFNLQIPGNTLFAAFLFGVLANPGVPRLRPVVKIPDFVALFRPREARSGMPGGYVGQAWQGNRPAVLTWIWSAFPVVVSMISVGLILPRWSGESEAEAARRAFLNGSYALVIYHAGQAVEHGNDDPDLFYYLGESRRMLANQFAGAIRTNWLQAAADAFDQGLKSFPMDERSLVKGGLTQAELGDYQKADTYFAQAFKWDPNLGQIYAFYGARLQLEGRDQDAIIAYQRSNQLSGNPIANAGLEQILVGVKLKRTGPTRPE